MRRKISNKNIYQKDHNKLENNSKPNKSLSKSKNVNDSKNIAPKFERYINNLILNKCRRPQREKWCAPVTIAEIIEILTGKNLSIDYIAKQMKWSADAIICGKLGTQSIIKGVDQICRGEIHHKLLSKQNLNETSKQNILWNLIKNTTKHQNKVLYYHQPGHHLLICGFFEELWIDPEAIWDHSSEKTRRWIVKAEHNLKNREYLAQGILVSEEFNTLLKNLETRKNTDLVIFYK